MHTPSLIQVRRMTVAAAVAVAGLVSIAGISHAQESAPAKTPTERQFHHGAKDPAKAAERFDRMIKRLVPDATAEQKAKLQAIAKSAFDDLRPLREKSRTAHQEGLKLLSQPTIDRNALERVRQTQQQLADQRSRRMSQAFADAAEVLTPAQRAVAAEKLAKRGHHKFGRHHHGDKPSQEAVK